MSLNASVQASRISCDRSGNIVRVASWRDFSSCEVSTPLSSKGLRCLLANMRIEEAAVPKQPPSIRPWSTRPCATAEVCQIW